MKTIVRLIITLVLLGVSVTGFAQDDGELVKIDGLWYGVSITEGIAVVVAPEDGIAYSGDIVIPSTITYKGTKCCVVIIEGAFRNCSGLTSVVIPNSVETIGSDAFSYCTSLTSVTIPNSVETIGYKAFAYCQGLKSVTIGNSVKTIGDNAFYDCDNLTSVTIPNSVESIGMNAFAGSENLKSVTIGNSVKTIGKQAFCLCGGLASITIPNSVESIGSLAFAQCFNLESVTIGNSVKTIGDQAFQLCYKLTSITIPNSVKSIGKMAFSACNNLTSVTILSVESIGEKPFEGCNIESLTVDCTNIPERLMEGAKVKTLTIGNSVISIGGVAFATVGLESVVIGSSVETIEEYAFYNNKNLTSVIMPNSLETIGDDVFGETGLTSVIIPNSVISIGARAFQNCESLEKAVIGNSVLVIYEDAFSWCKNLKQAVIPHKVQSIGAGAFANCDLRKIVLGKSVARIGKEAFLNNPNIWGVYCFMQTLPKINEDADVFYECNLDHTILYVPSSMETAYKNAPVWEDFGVYQELNPESSEGYPDQCATPTITYKDGKIECVCKRPAAATVYYTIERKDGGLANGKISLPKTEACMIKAYATYEGWRTSETATLLITVDAADVNRDGVVNVLDITTVTDKALGK